MMRETDETSKPRAWARRWGVATVALLLALGVLTRVHLHFLIPYPTPVSNDEGYLSAFGLRMIHGHWLPYVDGVSQRGPVLYWLTALAMRIGRSFSWVPIRILAMVAGLSTVTLAFGVAAELATPFAAGVAALWLTWFLGFELNPWDGVGLNGEVIAMVFALASMLCVARSMRGERARHGAYVVAAGVLVALAGLSKQMTLFHALPSAAWLLLGREGDTRSVQARALDLARFALGAAIPYGGVLLLYAATGHLGEFSYYYQRYGREIFMDPVSWEVYRDKTREQLDKYMLGIGAVGGTSVVAVAQGVGRWIEAAERSRVERLRHVAGTLFALGQLACGVLGAGFTGRFFPHYFVQLHCVAAVVAGLAASRAIGASAEYGERDPRGRRGQTWAQATLVFGAGVLLLIAAVTLARNVRTRRETDRWYQNPRLDPIARYVAERTTPSQKIFVWGFRAETYVSAERLPASRFVYAVYPSGVVPWFQASREDEERRQVPGARALLIQDLEREQPELVVDAGRSMSGRYMYNYPALRAYLDRSYCFMRYVDGEPVYRRRHGDHCPPADY